MTYGKRCDECSWVIGHSAFCPNREPTFTLAQVQAEKQHLKDAIDDLNQREVSKEVRCYGVIRQGDENMSEEEVSNEALDFARKLEATFERDGELLEIVWGGLTFIREEALHAERARLAGLVQGLQRYMVIPGFGLRYDDDNGKLILRAEVLALLEGEEG